MTKNFKLKDMMYSSIFAALISVLGYVVIPLPFSPVPVTGQTLGIMLAGQLLAPFQAFLSVFIFILLGVAGVPVFSGGRSGIGVLAGPSGGYIVGFLVGAVVISLLCRKSNNIWKLGGSAIVGGIIVVYLLGVSRLNFLTGMGLEKAIVTGALPFIPGDILKVIAATLLAKRLKPHLKSR
ncbi:biotin transporter BioY [Serpentinicella alkaliphila]|uniref:Biotin transporter n=1 Tax=Serpentinicella alkaliphila TaxID=1734049 RepID=A0A4R2UC08_9FIRM|nr:biotin transporter BioY [Serpentinicella alkaliphila]QUH27122.1 biotin transporter BioY [Serpentinicella alkaliphila]TCQ05253.1 biotin transport system substrate-specific component [Serpentinicella alkaliphila]